MTEYNSPDQNKNTSPYDEYLQQVKQQHQLTSKTVLHRLYELLKLEDPLMSKDDMYDRIMKDCLEIWQKRTIQNNMPDELKDPERVETGKKGRDKQLVSITNDGNVAHDTVGNRFTNENDEAKDLEIGKLKEQLAEQSKHYHDVLEGVNKSLDKSKPNKTVTESLEYKTLASQLEVANQRIIELEQILKKDIATNPAIGFQSATTIQRESSENASKMQPENNEIEFPAKDLSTFFLDQRQAKQVMYLKVEGNKVVGWESDTKRSGRQ